MIRLQGKEKFTKPIEDWIIQMKHACVLHEHLFQPFNEKKIIIDEIEIDYVILTGLPASMFNISMMDDDYPPEEKDFKNKSSYVKAIETYTDLQLFRSWYFNIFLDLGRDGSNFFLPSNHSIFIPKFISKNESYMQVLNVLLKSQQISHWFYSEIEHTKFNNADLYKLKLLPKRSNHLLDTRYNLVWSAFNKSKRAREEFNNLTDTDIDTKQSQESVIVSKKQKVRTPVNQEIKPVQIDTTVKLLEKIENDLQEIEKEDEEEQDPVLNLNQVLKQAESNILNKVEKEEKEQDTDIPFPVKSLISSIGKVVKSKAEKPRKTLEFKKKS